MRNWNGHRPDRRTPIAHVALAADVPLRTPAEHRKAQDEWNKANAARVARHTSSQLAGVPIRIAEWCRGVD